MQKVQNEGAFGDLLCDCGHKPAHDHQHCTSAYRCSKCGIVDQYDGARPQLVEGSIRPHVIFVCRYCGSAEYTLWNSYEAAKHAQPEGCNCQNNGDYCDYCQILLTQPEEE